MARFVFGDVTGGVNFDNLDVGALVDYNHFSQNATSVKLYDDSKNYFQVAGKNLDLQTAGGHIVDVSGTITFMTWKLHGQSAISATGLHADAHDLFVAAKTGDVDTFVDLVIGGDDTVIGTKFDDTLFGGAGKDRINGGGGADDLWGNSGADTFAFVKLSDSTAGKAGQDTIHGFTSQDFIRLSLIDASTHQSGNNSFKFIGTDDFDGSQDHGELRYEAKGSNTYVYGDVDGDSKADFAIHLTGHLTLDRDQFFL